MFQRQQQHIFRIDSTKLLYHQLGSGPNLVLVHGLAGSSRWWRYNVEALAKHFTVYVIDLVGYGSNRAWRPVRITTAAQHIADFIAQLPSGCAHIVAHSMGGQICTHLAAEHPDCVNRLALAAASGLVRSDLMRMMLRLPSTGRYGRLNFAPTLAYDSLRSGPLNLLMGALDILSNDVSEALVKITTPTLLIWGQQDKLVPIDVGQSVQRCIPGSRLEIIPRAGHVLMWDQPDIFNRMVIDFFLEARLEPSKPTA